MPRQTYGTIAHPGLRYNNPFSPAKMEEMIDLLQLPASAEVLDLGTGKAELLIRLVERYQVSALGLELDASDLQEAREQIAARIPSGRLELRQDDAHTFEPGPQTFDLACCVGACHIFGGIQPTLEHLAPWCVLGERSWWVRVIGSRNQTRSIRLRLRPSAKSCRTTRAVWQLALPLAWCPSMPPCAMKTNGTASNGSICTSATGVASPMILVCKPSSRS
jgi:SAM-dependent methyltransferase